MDLNGPKLLMEDIGGVVAPIGAQQLFKSPDGGQTLVALTESDWKEFNSGNLFESEDSLVARLGTFLTEERGSDGYLYAIGPMACCDKKNGNNRVYERGIWETVRNDKKVISRVQDGASKGHLEHPKDGKTDLNLVSHIMVPFAKKHVFAINEDGILHGKARILNTNSGKQLQELYRGGVCVGFSSRGKGSTYRRGNTDYVAKDYVFDTFDAVASPSVAEAIPKLEEKSSSKLDYTLASSQYEGINSSVEASSMGNSKDALRQLEENLRSISSNIETSSDAISLASLRESLLDNQMAIRSVVEQDPTVRDVAEELAEAARGLRAEITERMEHLKDVRLDETLSGTVGESQNDEVTQLREALRDTKERMDYWRAACEELAEADDVVTRKEYEAAVALSEGLLKKCKEFQAENLDLTEALEEVHESGVVLTEDDDLSEHPSYQLLEERYEKALLIIEELTERIRGAQVSDRVEEVIKIEPRFARIRDDLLECQTVDEVNARISRLSRLFQESTDGRLSEADALAILSEGFGTDDNVYYSPEPQYITEDHVAPQVQRMQLNENQAHRHSLISAICGTTSFRK